MSIFANEGLRGWFIGPGSLENALTMSLGGGLMDQVSLIDLTLGQRGW